MIPFVAIKTSLEKRVSEALSRRAEPTSPQEAILDDSWWQFITFWLMVYALGACWVAKAAIDHFDLTLWITVTLLSVTMPLWLPTALEWIHWLH